MTSVTNRRWMIVVIFMLVINPFAAVTEAEAPPEETESVDKPADPETEGDPDSSETPGIPESPSTEDADEAPIEPDTETTEPITEEMEPVAEESPGNGQAAEKELPPENEQAEEEEPDLPKEEAVTPPEESRHPVLLDAPQMSTDVKQGNLVLTLKGHLRPGSDSGEAQVIFEFPDSWSRLLMGSTLHAAFSTGGQERPFPSDAIRIFDGSGRVLIRINDPNVEDVYSITLLVSPGDSFEEMAGGMVYGQIAEESVKLASLPAEFVGQAQLPSSLPIAEKDSNEAEEKPAAPLEKAEPERKPTVQSNPVPVRAAPLQTGGLAFSAIPNTLQFEDVHMVNETVTVLRKNPGWTIRVNDSRGAGSRWQLLLQVDRPLTLTGNPSIRLPNALVFVNASGSATTIGSQAVKVHEAVTGTNPETSVSWNWNAGPLLRFNPSQTQAGHYKGAVIWTLVDGP